MRELLEDHHHATHENHVNQEVTMNMNPNQSFMSQIQKKGGRDQASRRSKSNMHYFKQDAVSSNMVDQSQSLMLDTYDTNGHNPIPIEVRFNKNTSNMPNILPPISKNNDMIA